jgi:predicted dehydrogenase
VAQSEVVGRARKVIGPRSTVDVETSVEQLLARDDVDEVAIATPAKTHAPLTLTALAAGKHVVVEKPIAQTSAEAAAMVQAVRSDTGLYPGTPKGSRR